MSAHRPTRLVALLLLLAAIASGCGSLPAPKLVGEPTLAAYDPTVLPPTCERPYKERAGIVADIVCPGRNYVAPGSGRNAPVADDYVRPPMDPIYPEPFDVALLVIRCVAAGTCAGEKMNPTYLAYVHHYAITVDPRAVARTLTTLPLDAELRKIFYRRFDACRTLILEQVANMPPRWAEVFIAPLEATRARLEALAVASSDQQAALVALTSRVDAALLAKKADPELRTEIETLRRDHAQVCMELGHELRSCLASTPLARRLTRLLVQLAILEGDHAAAAAEDVLLDRIGTTGDVRGELRLAMKASIDRELAVEAELSAARARGVQEDAIERTRGGASLVAGDLDNLVGADISSDDIAYGGYGGGESIPGIETGTLTDFEAQVQSVSRRGALADVVFRKQMEEYSEGYGCYTSNKVVQIDQYGNLIYEERCAGYSSHYEDRGAGRVVVPWSEAQRLRKGMIAYVYVGTESKRGHVVGIRPGAKEPFDKSSGGSPIEQYVELRGIARLEPSPKTPARTPEVAAVVGAAMAAELGGEWEVASQSFEAAYDEHPYPPLLLGLARALEHQGDLPGAAAAYERYLALGDDLPRAASARTAIAELGNEKAAAPPPLPELKPYSLGGGMSLGGGSSETTGGLAVVRLWSGILLLRDHVEGNVFIEGSGGDVSALFGLDARAYLLTGPIRPYVLGDVGIGKYDNNTSRPVRAAEIGGGVALMRSIGRRYDIGINAELAHRWVSIGSDPIFPQIMATSDEVTQFRVGLVFRFRRDR